MANCGWLMSVKKLFFGYFVFSYLVTIVTIVVVVLTKGTNDQIEGLHSVFPLWLLGLICAILIQIIFNKLQ